MNSTRDKILVGVCIAVFSGLILASIRMCAWVRDTVIRLEERSEHK